MRAALLLIVGLAVSCSSPAAERLTDAIEQHALARQAVLDAQADAERDQVVDEVEAAAIAEAVAEAERTEAIVEEAEAALTGEAKGVATVFGVGGGVVASVVGVAAAGWLAWQRAKAARGAVSKPDVKGTSKAGDGA